MIEDFQKFKKFKLKENITFNKLKKQVADINAVYVIKFSKEQFLRKINLFTMSLKYVNLKITNLRHIILKLTLLKFRINNIKKLLSIIFME